MKANFSKMIAVLLALLLFVAPPAADPPPERMTEPPDDWRKIGVVDCDGIHAEYPNVLKVGDTYHAYYSGFGCQWQIYHATSSDGLRWRKQGQLEIADEWAEVHAFPFVSYEAGRYRLYYSGGSPYRIGYAESSDGVNFTPRPAPVLLPGKVGAWDDLQVVRPSVVSQSLSLPLLQLRLPSLQRMYYTGFDVKGRMAIGMATSSDGLRWQKHPSPVLTSTSEIYTSFALLEAGTVYLYYREGVSIKLATSRDGINFTPHPLPILTPTEGAWAGGQVYGMYVRRNEVGGYTMYYNGIPQVGGNWGMIGIAEGTSLDRFTPRPDNPAITIGSTPASFTARYRDGQIELGWQRVVTDASGYTLKYGAEPGVYTATLELGSESDRFRFRPPAPGSYYMVIVASREGTSTYPSAERSVQVSEQRAAVDTLLGWLAAYDLTEQFSSGLLPDAVRDALSRPPPTMTTKQRAK